MDLLLIPAEEVKDLIIQTVTVVLIFSLVSSLIWRKSNTKWDRAAIHFDFLKVIFYLILGLLTLYLNYDPVSKKLIFSIDGKNLSLAEILVIMLAILEVISNIFSIIQRINNIGKSFNDDDLKNAFNRFKNEIELERLQSIASKKNQVEIDKEKARILLREQKLKFATKKRYKYK